MAFAYISEYAELPRAQGQLVMAPQEPSVAAERVAVGVASAQSSVFNAKTKFIRVHGDVIFSFKIGANPTAVATEGRMAANTTEFFGVNNTPGSPDRIAVITNT